MTVIHESNCVKSVLSESVPLTVIEKYMKVAGKQFNYPLAMATQCIGIAKLHCHLECSLLQVISA